MSASPIDNTASTVRLELPPGSVSIAIGRSVIRRIVTFRDSDAESSFLVAFTEIIANAIDEHQRLALDERIVVEITRGAVEAVRVADAGEGFDVSDVSAAGAPSTAGAVSERGRGLALARAFVSDMELDSSSSGTSVLLPLPGFGIVR